jgi:hypothetical protein
MQVPSYEEALKHETPLDVFISRWEPVDSKSYKKGFREDLAALIAYIEAAQHSVQRIGGTYPLEIDNRAVLVVAKQYDAAGDEVSISNISVPASANR